MVVRFISVTAELDAGQSIAQSVIQVVYRIQQKVWYNVYISLSILFILK